MTRIRMTPEYITRLLEDIALTKEADARATARYIACFDRWWSSEGSTMAPKPREDASEHMHRMTKLAWENGAYCENEEHIRLVGEVSRLNELLEQFKSRIDELTP